MGEVDLSVVCRRYRRRILEVSRQVSAAHVAPAFSCVEIVAALYHVVMRPDDIFIMSKGHGCLAQYVVLEDLKWMSGCNYPDCDGGPATGYCHNDCPHLDLLGKYCQPGGRLGAHPDYAPDIGIHASTGSLGHGLGIAAGQALAEKLKGSGARVFVLLSDGECQEGSTWEAAMVAANLRLDNLVAVVDANDWGGMDRMSAAFPALGGLTDKFRAFGWEAGSCDGHVARSIVAWMKLFSRTKPHVLVCRTEKGRGVSFIESGQPLWHYRSPTEDEYARALRELED